MSLFHSFCVFTLCYSLPAGITLLRTTLVAMWLFEIFSTQSTKNGEDFSPLQTRSDVIKVKAVLSKWHDAMTKLEDFAKVERITASEVTRQILGYDYYVEVLGPDSSNESMLAVLDAFVLQEEMALLKGNNGRKRRTRLILMSSILPYVEIVSSRTRALYSVHRQIVHKRSVRLILSAFRSVINASSRKVETLAAKKARETQEAAREAQEEEECRSYK